MGRALAALAALLVVVTDARPVADPERPFARVRASDDARYSDADAPLMMFPSAQLDGRLWARHADGAWARGEGRWRDANVAMAKYARVHRAVLEVEADADADATTAAAGEGGSRRREPRFVVWRGRHLAGCPFPRRLRAAASALALALVTDRAFLVDDPILERLLTSTRRARSSSTRGPVARRPRRRLDGAALMLKTTTTPNGETGKRGRIHPTTPCIAGTYRSRAAASRGCARPSAHSCVPSRRSRRLDRRARRRMTRFRYFADRAWRDAADVVGTFMSFLLRPARVTWVVSPAMLTTPEGERSPDRPPRVVARTCRRCAGVPLR